MPSEYTYPQVLCWIESHPGLAGYVQAVGSVLALIVAGRTVLLASRASRLTLLNGVDAAFKYCSDTIVAARESFTLPSANDASQKFDTDRFNRGVILLDQVEARVVDIGSELLPNLVDETRAAFASASESFKIAAKDPSGSEKRNSALSCLEAAEKRAAATRRQVQNIVARQDRLVRLWWLPFVRDR